MPASHVRISVLLPVFNAEATLRACLTSLSKQTHDSFEVVAVNDGSTDSSGRLLDEAATADTRIRVIHTGHAGIVGALRTVREHARGALLARMDADDVCVPDRLALQEALLRARPDVHVCSCLVGPVPGERLAGGYRHYLDWVNGLTGHGEMARERFVESPVPHPTAMLRADAFDRFGGYRDVDWPEDYDLWLRLFEGGCRFAKVKRVLVHWRDPPERLSRRDARYGGDAFARAKAHFLRRGPLAGKGAVVVWGAGRTTRLRARYLEEEGLRIAAWVDIDEKKTGNTIDGVPVIEPAGLRAFAGVPVLSWVGSRGAREKIRFHLTGIGREEGTDFWMCA